MNWLKSVIKSTIKRFGYDIHDIHPETTFFGLASLPIDVIVDVGANRGQFAERAVRVFPDAGLFCFEPVPEAFAQLEEWAKRVPNFVATYNVALGSEPGTQHFFVHADHTMSSSFLEPTELLEKEYPKTRRKKRIEVEVRRLDDYHGEIMKSDRKCILLKIDVEGFEMDVLKGSINTLGSIGAIIVEIHVVQLFKGHPSFREIDDFLYERNYRFSGFFFPPGTNASGRIVGFDAIYIRDDYFDEGLMVEAR